jgi:hypothetical protein
MFYLLIPLAWIVIGAALGHLSAAVLRKKHGSLAEALRNRDAERFEKFAESFESDEQLEMITELLLVIVSAVGWPFFIIKGLFK